MPESEQAVFMMTLCNVFSLGQKFFIWHQPSVSTQTLWGNLLQPNESIKNQVIKWSSHLLTKIKNLLL